jgi:hypothetical protein
MNNELIKYEIGNQNNLNDLAGTFSDIGELIAYMRDLTRTLVPLSNNLNDVLENFPDKIKKFFADNSLFAIGGIAGITLLAGYLGTGTVKNILLIKNSRNG